MAHVEKVVLAEAKVDDTRALMEESTSTTGESSEFFSAKEEPSRASSKDLSDCASGAAPSSSEYMSKRIQGMMESRSEYATAVEAEIEASKVHWSELQPASDTEPALAQADREVYRRLQQQYGCFFEDWYKEWELSEKIAEGAQAEIFTFRSLKDRGYAGLYDHMVVKVFKQEGWSLEDLQKQWPLGMLRNDSTKQHSVYHNRSTAPVIRGMMMDGRFAFLLVRHWGDFRKLIDLQMQHNGNRAPPFTDQKALLLMYDVARGMRALHTDKIIHRDLKASNVLIWPRKWVKMDVPRDGFDPIIEDYICHVADFECSVGVVGTRFWRAPEILLGVKTRNVQASLFTDKSDVYSFAMTFYEILTGKIPLEDLKPNDYDAVIQGRRPVLPKQIRPWIQALLYRCWDRDPSMRPSFQEIIEILEENVNN